MPHFRIVDDMQWTAVQNQIEQRRRPNAQVSLGSQNRRKPLLSGVICCSYCESS